MTRSEIVGLKTQESPLHLATFFGYTVRPKSTESGSTLSRRSILATAVVLRWRSPSKMRWTRRWRARGSWSPTGETWAIDASRCRVDGVRFRGRTCSWGAWAAQAFQQECVSEWELARHRPEEASMGSRGLWGERGGDCGGRSR